MPLTTGQQYAIYMLLAQHPNTTANDSKSAFRLAVENAAGPAPSPHALGNALRDQAQVLDAGIDTTAIGDLASLDDGQAVREALDIDYTGPGCPPAGTGQAVYDALNAAMP